MVMPIEGSGTTPESDEYKSSTDSGKINSLGTPVIFIIDDDSAIRDSLRLLVESVGYSVKTFNEPIAFLEEYDSDQLGCLILDIRMPNMSGLELQNKLNDMHCIMPTIFITGHGDVPMAVQAIKNGAMCFIQKPYRDQEILDSIHDALELDRRQRKELLEHRQILKRLSTLTERERDVLTGILQGKANKVIASDINLSQRTVEIHRSRIMEKMGTKSLAHLVRQIMQIQNHPQCNFPLQ